jgi:hypothetical protein
VIGFDLQNPVADSRDHLLGGLVEPPLELFNRNELPPTPTNPAKLVRDVLIEVVP